MELDLQTAFTPWASLGGGVLIGLSAVMVMGVFGKIAGIAGITNGALSAVVSLSRGPGDRDWRLAFLLALMAAPLALALALALIGREVAQTVPSNLLGMAIAGLLVGLGTALGSGCTSGHGVCGLARLSRRSLAAVATFMAAGFATVFVLRHLLGAA